MKFCNFIRIQVSFSFFSNEHNLSITHLLCVNKSVSLAAKSWTCCEIPVNAAIQYRVKKIVTYVLSVVISDKNCSFALTFNSDCYIEQNLGRRKTR